MDKSKFLWIAFGILLLIAVCNSIYRSNEKQIKKTATVVKETPTLIFDEREYFTKWSDRVDEKFIAISKALNTNRIRGCGEFYYNEIEDNTYIVGCSPDGNYFVYYVIWIKSDKVYSAESDMLTVYKLPK